MPTNPERQDPLKNVSWTCTLKKRGNLILNYLEGTVEPQTNQYNENDFLFQSTRSIETESRDDPVYQQLTIMPINNCLLQPPSAVDKSESKQEQLVKGAATHPIEETVRTNTTPTTCSRLMSQHEKAEFRFRSSLHSLDMNNHSDNNQMKDAHATPPLHENKASIANFAQAVAQVVNNKRRVGTMSTNASIVNSSSQNLDPFHHDDSPIVRNYENQQMPNTLTQVTGTNETRAQQLYAVIDKKTKRSSSCFVSKDQRKVEHNQIESKMNTMIVNPADSNTIIHPYVELPMAHGVKKSESFTGFPSSTLSIGNNCNYGSNYSSYEFDDAVMNSTPTAHVKVLGDKSSGIESWKLIRTKNSKATEQSHGGGKDKNDNHNNKLGSHRNHKLHHIQVDECVKEKSELFANFDATVESRSSITSPRFHRVSRRCADNQDHHLCKSTNPFLCSCEEAKSVSKDPLHGSIDHKKSYEKTPYQQGESKMKEEVKTSQGMYNNNYYQTSGIMLNFFPYMHVTLTQAYFCVRQIIS